MLILLAFFAYFRELGKCDHGVEVKRFIISLTAPTVLIFSFYDTARSDQISFKERIHFNLGLGWGNYDMKRGFIERGFTDDYIFTEYTNKRIEGGREYYGEIIFDYSGKFSFGAGILYSNGNTNLSEWIRSFLDDYNPPPKPDPVIYEASLTSPYLKLKYRSIYEVVNFSFNANIYYGFAALEADIPAGITYPSVTIYDRIRFKSWGAGYSLSLGISYKLAAGFFIVNDIGYRNLSVGGLEDSYGNKLANCDLDYGGYFIKGGISVNPWSR